MIGAVDQQHLTCRLSTLEEIAALNLAKYRKAQTDLGESID